LYCGEELDRATSVYYICSNAAKNWTQLQGFHLVPFEVSRKQWDRNFSPEIFVPWFFITNGNSDTPLNRRKKSTKNITQSVIRYSNLLYREAKTRKL
jgi:hypothetical protein